MKASAAIAIKAKELDKVVDAIYGRTPQRSREDEATDIFGRLRASPPKQQRSLQTLNRILDAAERVLEDDGLEAATIPRIARKAGVSVGVIYRRLPNKDALIRAIYERYFWRVNEQNSMMMATLNAANMPVEGILRALIRGSVETYRRKRKLVDALLQFNKTHPDMKRRSGDISHASIAALAACMLTQRDKIKHPDPEAAVRFAIVALGAIIRGFVVEDDDEDIPDDLEQQLTRMMFAYLGVQ